MRDIKITILSDGTAQIEEPFCFCGEHNAARLCITLNDELKTDVSYYLLSFDVYGLSRRIVSNIISGANSTPAYVTGGVIYCPLPEALTSTGELTVQVEAHKRNDLEVTRITKSAVFTLGFEPSVMGIDGELEEECGILPELAAAVESMRDLKALFGGTTDLKAVIINSLGFTPQAPPAQYTYSTAQVSATLADNAEYRMTGLQTLTVQYPEDAKFECWMRLSFAASGDITVTLPAGTGYIGSAPDFKNGETWELSFKDKVLAAKKVGDDDKDAGGENGVTPHIGDNGNWYIGNTDTGKPSRGVAGARGDTGATGADGKTPVKGTDYWTVADKQEIVNDVIAVLPDGTEVSY